MAPQFPNPPDLLARFCEIARPIMLKWFTRNSCIGATRVTLGCMKALGFHAIPVPMKLAFEVPRLGMVYTSGLTTKEMAQFTDSRQIWEHGWNGHLVARVNRRWLIDASLDQAHAACPAIEIPQEAVLWPLPKHTSRDFHVTYEVTLNSGDRARIQYLTTQDHSYTSSEAWNDEAVPYIVRRIVEAIRGDRARGLAAPQSIPRRIDGGTGG